MKETGKKIYKEEYQHTDTKKKEKSNPNNVRISDRHKKNGRNKWRKRKISDEFGYSHSMRMNKSKYMKIEDNKK